MVNVVIYSTEWCSFCKRAKAYFNENKIKFTEKHVDSDQAALTEMLDKSGQQGVPVIDIDGMIIVGFDKPAIEKALSISAEKK